MVGTFRRFVYRLWLAWILSKMQNVHFILNNVQSTLHCAHNSQRTAHYPLIFTKCITQFCKKNYALILVAILPRNISLNGVNPRLPHLLTPTLNMLFITDWIKDLQNAPYWQDSTTVLFRVNHETQKYWEHIFTLLP